MNSKTRVVVTGIGPVSPIGTGKDEYADALISGSSGASEISAFSTDGFEQTTACEVANLPRDPQLERASQFAVTAALLAVEDAQLSSDRLSRAATAVYVGTTDGESQCLDAISERLLSETKPSCMEAIQSFPLNLSRSVVSSLGLKDVEYMTIATACSAGNYAVGAGYDAIRSGDVELAIVGGADALCRKTFTGFYRLGTVAPERCQPFDLNRRGILTAEGAGMMVLESLEHAVARGAHIYAEVAGYAINCDAKHPVAPDVEGVKACMNKALQLADIQAEEVDLISAHGTGTRSNDVSECNALMSVFNGHLPPVISMKSMLGHTMGASSALAVIGCLLAMENQVIPPTINFETPDPECPVDCVPNRARQARLDVVMNDGLAFGGNNAVVLLRRVKLDRQSAE
ncbi:beta-ketoacyl synthase [Actinomyces slackii]|uniref:3-oxoacyl-[acyl-carrier-protein] synthase 2 n=1 Tax=Actinomyces slackii TaxID=52774 RepID=A0A448KFT0_9ACTO|nr:beta-ketoacyl-[acyl-carrier-protein] synthase family protein [Actinomyces slackii]VEG75779.1 3-oxoacyl-[acyl-carrier-protein] synthase 2 [Actinomyces slackii]